MKKGEVWLVEFPFTNGHEQTGTRPVIVLADVKIIAVILPLTSNIQALRFPYTLEIEPSKANGLTKDSITLLFQIRAIDKKRLIRKVGNTENSIMQRIDEIIKKLLKI